MALLINFTGQPEKQPLLLTLDGVTSQELKNQAFKVGLKKISTQLNTFHVF